MNVRVGFDARPVLAPYGGIGQYVRQIFPRMSHLDSSIDWIAFASEEVLSALMVDGQMDRVTRQPIPRRWSPKWVCQSGEQLNIFHGTNFRALQCGQKKTVLTIHDLWLDRYPVYSKKLFGQGLSSWKTRHSATRADKIIAVSQFSKEEIQDVFSIPSEKIVVIHHGCSGDMFPDRDGDKWRNVCTRLGLPHRPYLMFMGGAEPRKNHRILFEAMAQSSRLTRDCSLIMIGDETVRGTSLNQDAKELGLSHIVQCLGSLSTDDLRLVYSNAIALVFPSLYEGFGIPLIEAMACGAPIVTGEQTAMPEVAGNAALYVNVQNVEQLGAVLEKLVEDVSLQEHLRQKGFERVKQFTWERAARKTLAVYQELC